MEKVIEMVRFEDAVGADYQSNSHDATPCYAMKGAEMNINEIRLRDGKLPAYAWPGGYPMYYLAKDNGVLCPKCANDYTPERDNEDQLKPVAYDVNYEDPQLFCDNCNTRIESAYAEDEQ